MAYCSYPDCKCIVSTSTSQPEPECPKGLERDVRGTATLTLRPVHSDAFVQAKTMTVNRTRRGAMDAVSRYLELPEVKADAEKRDYWLTVKSHLQNSSFD